LLLLLALLLAVAGSLFATAWLKREAGGGAGAPIATRLVWVAAGDLSAGDRFTAANATSRLWPADSVADGQLAGDAAALLPYEGAVLGMPVSAGHPLLASHFRHGAAGALAALVAPGMRAVSLAVSAASGLSGLVVPGDRVDVVVARTLASGRSVAVVPVLDAKVLGIDQRLSAGPSEDEAAAVPATVTLEVTPEQAGALALIGNDARIMLMLRPASGSSQPAAAPAPIWEERALGLPAEALRPAVDAIGMAALPTPAPAPSAMPTPAPAEAGARTRQAGVEIIRGSSVRGEATAAPAGDEP
jgi:pilus assembly protein CpaB